jgi:hypothetical protein
LAGFDAASVVEPLDYAFDSCKGNHEGSCWRGSETEPRPAKCTVFVPGCHGVVAEPDDRQIARYMAGLKKLAKDYEGRLPDSVVTGDPDAAKLTEAAAELDPEVVVELHGDVATLFAALCSNEPSREDILKVPPRIRAFFYQWLAGEVMSPEAASGGGNAQVKTLRSVAAG